MPVTLIELYKAIQQREGANNYLEVLDGLVTMHEDIIAERDKEDAQR